jgi:hypothetical protein
MRNYSFQGKEISLEEMAKLVLENAKEHQWFDDEPPAAVDGQSPFDGTDISALGQARLKVGADVATLGRPYQTQVSFLGGALPSFAADEAAGKACLLPLPQGG